MRAAGSTHRKGLGTARAVPYPRSSEVVSIADL
jgi:hypothetical protein